MPIASDCSSKPAHHRDIVRRYYEQEDASVLPRNVATSRRRERMTLDIAMGGSTNTWLHLLAAAHEGQVEFTMRDIDRLSRRVPVLLQGRAFGRGRACRGRASRRGIMGILGELDRAGLIDTWSHRSCAYHERRAGALGVKRSKSEKVRTFFRASPGGIPTQVASARSAVTTSSIPIARRVGPQPRAAQPERRLACLRQPRAGRLHREDRRRCSLDPEIRSPARVFESQDAAVEGILGGRSSPARSWSSIYEGPRGGPACRRWVIRRAI